MTGSRQEIGSLSRGEVMSILFKLTLCDVFVANMPYLRRVAQQIMHTADLADEVVQDAYLKLVRSEVQREVCKPLSYCCQIVRNMAFDHHRQCSSEWLHRTWCDDIESSSPVTPNVPELTFGGRQALAEVDKVLEELAPRTRQAFELSRVNGLTQREIGAHLGCSATLVNFMIKEAEGALERCRHVLGFFDQPA